MSFTTIISEGNLIPADLLAQIAAGEAEGQQPTDFGFEKARRLTDEIAAAWADVKVYWEAFQRSLRRLRNDDPATTVTRERWIIPLLETLGYQLTYMPTAAVVGGRTYALSHRATNNASNDGPPVHIEGFRRSLDQRGPAGRPRLSPHALVQEYLNSTEQLWGLVTNGERLRLLRDSSRTVRPVYVEFDLRAMLEGEKFSEFALLYRLLHRTRLPQSADDAPRCLLERYHQQAIEAGGRVRDGLRDGVELALRALGDGLLRHPGSAALREKVAGSQISALDYYRQLLRLVYRLLFLMVAEERKLVGLRAEGGRLRVSNSQHQPSALSPQPSEIYYQHYSITRLRRLAERSSASTTRHSDLWLGLLTTFRLLEDDEAAQALGVAALDGDLFGPQAMPDLAGARLDNATLLRVIRALSLYRDPQSKTLRRVNYAALDVEELGSVYESLLDYRPVVRAEASATSTLSPQPSAFSFDLVAGTERKTTGSYYTRPELVHELIKSALEPVLEERLKADSKHQPSALSPQPLEEAILSLKVVDPAAGSGHFLLAAARRLGRELARVRSGEDQPSPAEYRRAVRDVIARCIYAVDLNPLAVDLCKVALWLESLEPGKPLSFLDSKVRWGNSLVGATRELVAQGIPDDAYKPVTGDDKAAASAFRKRNKKEREAQQSGQLSLGLEFGASDPIASPSAAARALNAMPDDSVAAVRAKARRYEELRAGAYADIVRFNLWTAAFFSPLTDPDDLAVPTTASLDEWNERPLLHNLMIKSAFELAQEIGFFHWELEFPDVFGSEKSEVRSESGSDFSLLTSGFDVVLGNPPWERIKLQEQEHFVDVPEIAQAANKAAREKAIAAWRSGDERQRARIAQFDAAKYRAEAESRFVRASGRFPLTAVGDVNTYALFAEHSRNLLASTGRAGIIVPTGIATADTTKQFFESLINSGALASLFDFLEARDFFAGLESRDPFCLLTLAGRGIDRAEFVFAMLDLSDLKDERRRVRLATADFALMNPNTRTCPIFRTAADAELTQKLYRRIPVLQNERAGTNPWNISFLRMLDMANDSHLFRDVLGEGLVPLYEAKLLHQFTHRWATYSEDETHVFSSIELSNPSLVIEPRYFVPKEEVDERLASRWSRKWLLAFRDIARANDERTAIFGLLPRVGVGHKAPVILFNDEVLSLKVSCFLACVDSLTFDFVSRKKVGGTSLAYFILKQLPVLLPERFSEADIAYIVPRVVELVYTAWDIKAFAEDVINEVRSEKEEVRNELLRLILERHAACNREAPRELFPPTPGLREDGSIDLTLLTSDFSLPPFRWDEGRRAIARAELDARIARLYGLTRDELRYILDPADVYGPEFPGETFRVLKEKEIRQLGEYRTRRLVLEAWDAEEVRSEK